MNFLFQAGIIDDAIELKFLPPDVDKVALHKALQRLYDNAMSVPDNDSADFQVLINKNKRFFAVSYELNKIFFVFPFCMPDYFALLTRVMIVLEGIAVTGNPNFDLFSSAYPYAFRRAVNLFGFSDLSQIATEAVKYRLKTQT
jgi:aarF domain-containing kinase